MARAEGGGLSCRCDEPLCALSTRRPLWDVLAGRRRRSEEVFQSGGSGRPLRGRRRRGGDLLSFLSG